MATLRGRNTVANDEIITTWEFERQVAAKTSEATGPIVPLFEHLQALMSQIWVDGVAVATRCSQLSTHLGQDGVILYWDEGQMEIIGEGICSAEDENQDSTNSSFIHKAPHYKLEEDNSQKSLVLSEDRPHDKEMARCLTTLNSLPHVPKINADIPAQKVASEDHQRLLDRLSLYGLSEQKIEGDGNCQFRALSDQLYHSPEYHNFVRDSVVKQLRMTPDAYSGYVQMEYGDYLEKMAKSGEWGDHVTLQAAADYYGVRISLVTSFKDTCFIEIVPTQQKSKQEIYLSFWAEVHYNSIHTLRILQ
ncbi:hypothetical protein BDL97_08G069300 [Sphagnum fallax]|nr:hypothetical protein BDL97_08G069300 [Sphagnum fallax]KAH8954236.1 hypothetical protein BDL97_08G069300 [Sphagnum fallax]KAH8954243.1 hypothetical protein BDL97_08G069300 [Sphagnum fallax]